MLCVGLFKTADIKVHYCPDNTWKENEITWENKPEYEETATDTTKVSISEEWYTWDIKKDVKTALSTRKLSIVLRTETSRGEVSFYHRGEEYKPELIVSYTEKKGCIIATATYGSELSPEVQFLRSFRDNEVLSTFAGSQFMVAFNSFYYSFSPSVASVIADNTILRGTMKIILYPLIGILHLAEVVYCILSFTPEFAIVLSGLVASSLIGIVYLMPLSLLILWKVKSLQKHVTKVMKLLQVQ